MTVSNPIKEHLSHTHTRAQKCNIVLTHPFGCVTIDLEKGLEDETLVEADQGIFDVSTLLSSTRKKSDLVEEEFDSDVARTIDLLLNLFDLVLVDQLFIVGGSGFVLLIFGQEILQV